MTSVLVMAAVVFCQSVPDVYSGIFVAESLAYGELTLLALCSSSEPICSLYILVYDVGIVILVSLKTAKRHYM